MRIFPLSLLVALTTLGCSPESRTDLDGDGIAADVDCNDLDESIGAPRAWVADGDGDGWGGEGAETKTQCDRPTEGNWAIRVGDCDDGDPGISPGAEETCNGVDDDCDGFIDEGTELYDDDGDGLAEIDGDCDDSDVLVVPGAEESQNDIDDDCDGLVDEGSFVFDDDGDGYAEIEGTIEADCDDTDPWVSPDRIEDCDGVDNDCDGTIDEGEDGTARGACTFLVERRASEAVEAAAEDGGCSTGAPTRSGAAMLLAMVGLGIGRRRFRS